MEGVVIDAVPPRSVRGFLLAASLSLALWLFIAALIIFIAD
jgi:hypothetical protein